MMVTFEDPWHPQLLPNVWQWSCHYLYLRLRSVAAGIRTPNFCLRGKRSNTLRHRRGSGRWRVRQEKNVILNRIIFRHTHWLIFVNSSKSYKISMILVSELELILQYFLRKCTCPLDINRARTVFATNLCIVLLRFDLLCSHRYIDKFQMINVHEYKFFIDRLRTEKCFSVLRYFPARQLIIFFVFLCIFQRFLNIL